LSEHQDVVNESSARGECDLAGNTSLITIPNAGMAWLLHRDDTKDMRYCIVSALTHLVTANRLIEQEKSSEQLGVANESSVRGDNDLGEICLHIMKHL